MRSLLTMASAILMCICGLAAPASAQYLGNYNSSRYDPNSISNPYGAGSPYNPNSVNNPYGRYGSQHSNDSANNPYATNAPKVYDQDGNYRGRLSKNPYDPDSTSNPYGRYGNRFSPDSVNNPYGAGNRFGASQIGVFGGDDD